MSRCSKRGIFLLGSNQLILDQPRVKQDFGNNISLLLLPVSETLLKENFAGSQISIIFMR